MFEYNQRLTQYQFFKKNHPMKSTKLQILNSKGHTLHAYLELPANQKPSHFVIFAHCFTCSSSLQAVKNISRALTVHGFGVIRFDFTGLGRSEGEFAESHFSSNVADILSVHTYIKTHYKAPCMLVGHSLGGAAVITAASQLDDIKAVATIGAPATVTHVKRLFTHNIDELSENTELQVNIGGRPFTIDKQFISDFDKTDLPTIVKNLRKPLLILHSPIDTIVGIENAKELYIQAHHPKSFISLDNADHLLSNTRDSQYAGNMIGAWAARYFPIQNEEIVNPNEALLIGHLNLIEDKFTTTMQTKNHHMVADEPLSIGGDDFGPSPYEYLYASLAACTTMTLKMYADRKGWDLQEVFVYISHEKRKNTDLNIPMEKPTKIDFITKKLQLIGHLSEAQRARLKEISARCPVHRTLESQVILESELMF